MAIDRHRLNDETPYIYRTNDDGKSWTRIDSGIPRGSFVNVVREDPVRPGLLYAGTEFGLYVSFDDGAHWQSLQQSLPITSVRDIDVHGDDLVIATHGRGFWIMDDVSALRQMDDVHSGAVTLFKPADAIRVRAASFTGNADAEGRADGRQPSRRRDHRLCVACRVQGPVVVTIRDAGNQVVRSYTSAEHVPAPDAATLEFAPEWVPPTPVPSAAAGMQRFVWDLRYGTAAAPGSRHALEGRRSVGASRPVHRRADSGGTRLSPASRRETRSAGEAAASRLRA